MYKGFADLPENVIRYFNENDPGIITQWATKNLTDEQVMSAYNEKMAKQGFWGTLGLSIGKTTGNVLKTTGTSWLEQKLGISKPIVVGTPKTDKSFLQNYGLYLGVGAIGLIGLIMFMGRK